MSHPCDMCEKVLKTADNLRKHRYIHTGETPYRCTYDGCSYASRQPANLQTHMRVHTGEKPYKCTACESTFSQKGTLTKHMYTHTGERPFKCSQCDYATAQKQALQTHIRTHTGERPYKCDKCEYSATQKQGLVEHVRSHTGERPFQCVYPECGRTFPRQSSLDYHTLSHTGEKRHTCSHCNRAFATSGILRTHALIHENQRPYVCEYERCSYAGRTSSQLYSHVRQHHTGESPYKCEYCNESFTQLNTLVYHTRRIHTGERPFSCDFEGCGLSFIMKGQLDIHRRTHTGERPYKCSECDAAYIAKGSLVCHIRAYHTIEGQQARKREEQRIADLLDSHQIAYKREHSIDFQCIGGSRCRVDFVIIENGSIVFLEVDEAQHSAYEVSCEVRRMIDAHSACVLEGNTMPVHFIRYNPDAFSVGETIKKIPRVTREKQLVRLLHHIRTLKASPPLSIHYMFYNVTETGELVIASSPEFPESARQLVTTICVESSPN